MKTTIRALLSENFKRKIRLLRVFSFEILGSERFSWPALNELDRKLVAALPRTGTFLEVGGNDGYTQSNTWYLERRRNWTGILIEPLPRLHAISSRIRTKSTCLNLALVDSECAGRLIEMHDSNVTSIAIGLQSTTHERARELRNPSIESTWVPSATLSEVIEKLATSSLTLISIDVEGAELSLLEGLNLDRHCPDWLLIETQHVEAVDLRLNAYMTLHSRLTHHDYLYQKV